jgi:hypothetical protein
MSQIVPPFGSADFIVFANRNATVRISLKDQNCNWLSPPFSTGYFAISPYAGQPFIFDRNTGGLNVRFTSLMAGQWYLDADILPTDTVALAPGVYYYEARLDFDAGQYEVKSGLFLLKATYI